MQTCPFCGGELKAEILGGLCPKCLLHKAGAGIPGSPGENLEDGTSTSNPPALEAVAETPGDHIDRDTLLQHLGEGGMGRAWLADQPVLAGPPSRFYRVRMWMRRHQAAFAGVTAVAAVLVLGVVVSTWQADRAATAERVAVTERDQARLAQKRSEQERKRADQAHEAAQRHLYVATMNLVQVAWEQNNVRRVRELLAETASYPDRGFEWYYWHRRTHLDDFTILDPNGWIAMVAFSPDGSRLATGGPQTTTKIWEVNSRRILHELIRPPDPSEPRSSNSPQRAVIPEEDGIWGVAWSIDGKRILTSGEFGRVRLWDADTGKLHQTYPKPMPKDSSESFAFRPPDKTGLHVRHSNRVEAACLSPDGTRVLSGDNNGGVIIWDTESGEALHSLSVGGEVHAAAFSSDGRYFALGDYGGTLGLYDGTNGNPILSFQGSRGPIESLAFTPDGTKIVTVGQYSASTIWDVRTGSVIRTFKASTSNDMSVAISPDGRRVVTGGTERKARLWSLDTGENILTLEGHIASIEAAAFSPNGRQFVTASEAGEIKFWNCTPKPVKVELGVNVPNEQSLAFAPDGHKLAIGTSAGTIQMWDVPSGKRIGETTKETQVTPGHGQVWSLAFYPSGRRLVAGGTDGSVKIWDAETLQLLETLEGHQYFTGSIAVSPDGSRIVSAAYDGAVIVWSAESGDKCSQFEQKGHAEGVAIAPDGQRFASACSEGPLKIWGLKKGNELLALPGAHGPIAFSPEGNLLTIYHTNRQYVYTVIDPSNGTTVYSFTGSLSAIRSLCFSPDGHRILAGDSTARLFDSTTGRELLSIPHNVYGNSAFSPDGHTMAICSENRTTLYIADRPGDLNENQ